MSSAPATYSSHQRPPYPNLAPSRARRHPTPEAAEQRCIRAISSFPAGAFFSGHRCAYRAVELEFQVKDHDTFSAQLIGTVTVTPTASSLGRRLRSGSPSSAQAASHTSPTPCCTFASASTPSPPRPSAVPPPLRCAASVAARRFPLLLRAAEQPSADRSYLPELVFTGHL
jgi:hypothetical protein